MARSGAIVGVALSMSCGGIAETVELLRAQRIHILDASSNLELDVGAELRQLRARATQLEQAQGAARPTAPIPSR
jgi:hypothetical protein